MIHRVNGILEHYNPQLPSFVKTIAQVFRGLILRFFTMEKEFKALTAERIKKLSLIEVQFLSATQLQLLGIEWSPTKPVKKHSIEKNLPSKKFFDQLLDVYESGNSVLKKRIATELISEKEETLVSIVRLSENSKRYIPTIFIVESFLVHKKSLNKIAPHLSEDCIKFIIEKIQSKPIIKDFLKYTLTLDEEKRRLVRQNTPTNLYKRHSGSHKNFTVQKNGCSNTV